MQLVNITSSYHLLRYQYGKAHLHKRDFLIEVMIYLFIFTTVCPAETIKLTKNKGEKAEFCAVSHHITF